MTVSSTALVHTRPYNQHKMKVPRRGFKEQNAVMADKINSSYGKCPATQITSEVCYV